MRQTLLFIGLLAALLMACSPDAATPTAPAEQAEAASARSENSTPTATLAVYNATAAVAEAARNDGSQPAIRGGADVLDDSTIDLTATAIAEVNRTDTDDNGFIRTPVIELAGLQPGEARARALATDEAFKPDVSEPVEIAGEAPFPLTFADFYSGFDIRRGMIFTDYLASLDGQQVTLEGYVAPPLKPRLDWFVLTRMQLSFCPFCSQDTEWPADIALIYLDQEDIVTYPYPVRITGQLEVGSNVDAETGMVSLVRIYADSVEPAG